MATPPPGKESLHTCSSRYTWQHIWSMSFKKNLNIFHSAGTNHLPVILSPVICRMPIKSDRIQSLLFKLTFDNFPNRVTQIGPERAIFVNPFHPKGRHTQEAACPTCTRQRPWSREPSDLYQNMLVSECCPTEDMLLTRATGVTPHLPIGTM